MQTSDILLWIQIFVGAGGIVGFAHSAYRGTVRRAARAVRIVPEIQDEVEGIDKKVDGNTDAILALVEAHNREDVEVKRDAIRDELQREPDEDRFLPDRQGNRWASDSYPED